MRFSLCGFIINCWIILARIRCDNASILDEIETHSEFMSISLCADLISSTQKRRENASSQQISENPEIEYHISCGSLVLYTNIASFLHAFVNFYGYFLTLLSLSLCLSISLFPSILIDMIQPPLLNRVVRWSNFRSSRSCH